ncbi:MAG: DUF3307 domain-containing protein [Rhodobacteraceae bacterium]|nr:DUF3307 domain-containing protein [Paracoccaceae bacterium]MCB1411370.1 DUF3307 domain-containing protein [Paracoccaceae bacterium]
MTPGILTLLVALQVKHLLADYVLQGPYMFRNKGRYGHPGGLLHAGLHALLTAAILLLAGGLAWVSVGIAAVELLIHYHVDWAKERIGQRLKLTPATRGFWSLHGLDQLVHHLTYVAIAWVSG